MEKHGTDRNDDLGVNETPEDVAVLYSWANLHGAKYRDFSASRREYRAQLRHRAAEQVRQQALIAQAEAEAAAEAAEAAARRAAEAAQQNPGLSESAIQQNLREAEEAARTAAAERLEAARRAEAAATAEANALREEREIADAHASAERHAARHAERPREFPGPLTSYQNTFASYETADGLPGRVTDPYTAHAASGFHTPHAASDFRAEDVDSGIREPYQPVLGSPEPTVPPLPPRSHRAEVIESLASRAFDSSSTRRREGYHPDEASGVREIYRGQGSSYDTSAMPTRRASDRPDQRAGSGDRHTSSTRERRGLFADSQQDPPAGSTPSSTGAGSASGSSGSSGGRKPYTEQTDASHQSDAQHSEAASEPSRVPPPPPPPPPPPRLRESSNIAPFWEQARPAESTSIYEPYEPKPSTFEPRAIEQRQSEQRASGQATERSGEHRPAFEQRPYESGFVPAAGPASAPAPGSAMPVYPAPPAAVRPISPFSQLPSAQESPRGRRADDLRGSSGFHNPLTGTTPPPPIPGAGQRAESFTSEPGGPAWFYAPVGSAEAQPPDVTPPPPMTSVAETLQYSRERVAARWFALKGVFDQPGAEAVAEPPVRLQEVRTPVFAVFSLAGGVGKTSLIATVGRSLSSLGEKVLLTDTTSQGLLPFYFGASELRHGTVRTFSPPSGSTDAPIYLVSYEVGTENAEPEKEQLVEQILASSRGTHRILLDLSVNTAWLIRQLARMSPTILVPLAPDMNSVISLQAIEKFFSGMVDGDGRPLEPYYMLNQFDTSLPLHLDVREVLRRQLGDRLLPFVIHRAPEVSEALAEGMTVVDYSPDSPVSGDYRNVATWLRTVAAPATAGFRNVRWSER